MIPDDTDNSRIIEVDWTPLSPRLGMVTDLHDGQPPHYVISIMLLFVTLSFRLNITERIYAQLMKSIVSYEVYTYDSEEEEMVSCDSCGQLI